MTTSGTAMHVKPQLRLRSKFVSRPVNGQKESRLFGGGFKFLAKTNEVRVDGARVRLILVPPDFVEKTLATQILSGVTDEIFEEFEFLRGEVE